MAKKDKEKAKSGKKEKEKKEVLCPGDHAHGDLNAVKADIPPLDTLFQLAELFKVFGDTTRIRIMCVLFQKELCVCEIAELLEMGQSAISHQLRLLRNAHLVKVKRDGKQSYYSLDDAHVREIYLMGLEHISE
ncbi:MAG: metalloregulator ArsR/SmtB family transcription factor [Ruminococcus bromii]|nr:metalloregulator ArsR/SmtB family transcription factor [Ruminococcus bromii]